MYSTIYQEDLDRICQEELPFQQLQGKSVLVTGANGLIGSCLVDTLMNLNLRCGYQIKVYALCRNKEKAEKRFVDYTANDLFSLIIADVTQPMEGDYCFDYIIHAASNAHPIAYATEPADTMKANILGTIHLLEYARNNRVDRFLFVSSSEIYGENSGHLPGFKEEDIGYLSSMSDRACYPESKRAAEALCVSYAKQYQINTVVVRPGYIYGITMNDNNSRADVQFIKRALLGQDIIMKSSGSQIRSYCYLSDTISAILYVLLLGKSKEAYNIANKDCNITIAEYAHALAAEAKVRVLFELPDEIEKQGYTRVMNSVLNADKLRNLGWEAKIDLNEGMRRLMAGLKEV